MSAHREITADDLEFDRKHIWHPYSSMREPLPTYPVVAADGVRLQLADGRELIDGMSSWWSAIHGYCHPLLDKAVTDQLAQMSHVMFGGITHRPAIDLARTLLKITPAELETVFFCDSGSVSVEVAMKMALQYWVVRGRRNKNTFLTIRSGYHGDTFHAMSVCDPVNGMHELFSDTLAQQVFAAAPACAFHEAWNPDDIVPFQQAIEQHADTLAAVILEPIVQGAGGMRFYNAEYLRQVRRLCDQNDVLLIADEIATGFGRSGRLFACQHADVVPDMLCVGKALTGGYVSLAATFASGEVSTVIGQGRENSGVLMHGPTFMANPLACAVAGASMRLLLDSPWEDRVRHIESILKETLSPCWTLDSVADVRVLGAIGVVEMRRPVNIAETQAQFVQHGAWVRPFGKLIYVMPPYVICEHDLRLLGNALVSVVRTIET